MTPADPGPDHNQQRVVVAGCETDRALRRAGRADVMVEQRGQTGLLLNQARDRQFTEAEVGGELRNAADAVNHSGDNHAHGTNTRLPVSERRDHGQEFSHDRTSGPRSGRVGWVTSARERPFASTTAALMLVPPTSTAITTPASVPAGFGETIGNRYLIEPAVRPLTTRSFDHCEQQDHRNRGDHRAGEEVAPVDRVLADVVVDRDGQRLVVARGAQAQRQRHDEFIPGRE